MLSRKPVVTRTVLTAVVSLFLGVFFSSALAEGISAPKDITVVAWVIATIVLAYAIGFVAISFSTSTASDTAKIREQISSIASSTGRYSFRDDMENDVSAYKGHVFKHLAEEISQARCSIRAVSLASVGDPNYLPASKDYGKARSAYFAAIETRLQKKREGQATFKYHRILQYPQGGSVPNSYSEHIGAVKALASPDVVIDVRRIDTARMTGFLIIDDRTLVLMLGGVVFENRGVSPIAIPYLTNLIVMSGGQYKNAVGDYARYFDYVFAKSESV